MSAYTDWNIRDLAKAAKVEPSQIADWYMRGLLKGTEDSRGVVRFPLTESVAAYALRDGRDPQAARDELLAGRSFFRAPDEAPPRRSRMETENTLQDFLVANRLPQPKREYWGDGDPREEVS